MLNSHWSSCIWHKVGGLVCFRVRHFTSTTTRKHDNKKNINIGYSVRMFMKLKLINVEGNLPVHVRSNNYFSNFSNIDSLLACQSMHFFWLLFHTLKIYLRHKQVTDRNMAAFAG